MERELIRTLLEDVKEGNIDIHEALEKLAVIPYNDLGFAKLDTHRDLRQGFPEVIYCPNKTVEQIIKIIKTLINGNRIILATKATKEVFAAVSKEIPEAQYNELAKIIYIGEIKATQKKGYIAVVSAGTADLPIAEEAAFTAEAMGNKVERFWDVGVAGLHRLLSVLEKLRGASVLVVVAGMEGALPSVVGGLVEKPVIAVPTSVGYGTSFSGVTPLLAMLNSCASGIGVMNIDNGFGAGVLASKINALVG